MFIPMAPPWRYSLCCAVSSIAFYCLIPSFAIAQESSETNSIAVISSYEPDYFLAYNPQTALDMVNQIPGFAISFADEKRGLGDGGANVLVNGRRLTGKTDPESQLAQLSAKNITAIDIVDGVSLSIPGLAGQVVNIRTVTKGQNGNWRWSPEFTKGIETDWFNGEVSLGGKWGDLEYLLKVQNNSSRAPSSGPESLLDATGTIFQTRNEKAKEYYDRPGASLNLKHKPKLDHIFNLNAAYEDLSFLGDFVSRQSAVTGRGDDRTEILNVVGQQWTVDLGVDYEFPLSIGAMDTGRLKLIGFYDYQDQNPVREFDILDETGLVQRTKFPQMSIKSELIFRGEYSLPLAGSKSWQASLEGAFNDLDVENQFLIAGSDGVFIGNPINGFIVNEDRGEINLSHSRKISNALDLQFSLGGEYSLLKQSSNTLTENRREFIRPKGFISASYKYSSTMDVRARLEREVGQLNFFDFVSSTNLQDDLDVTANPELVPAQSWLANIQLDKDLGQGSRFTSNIYGAIISDIIDHIPIGADGEGVGNLDQAYRYGIDFLATLKGERWGWDGIQLDLRLELRNSSLTDSLQGFKRRINSDKIGFYIVEFRHDVVGTGWAYGGSAERFYRAPEYRAFSFSETDFDRPYVKIFLERKNIFGIRIRGEVSNLTDRVTHFDRTFYTDRRDIGGIDHVESRERRLKPFVRLDISGQF